MPLSKPLSLGSHSHFHKHSFSVPVRIFLFGEVRLEVGGNLIALPQRESLLRLFVRLLLQSGQPQARKALAFSLWPDETEANALANLRRHLYLLRRALPPAAQGLLHISSQTVLWAESEDCWLDVRAFACDSDETDELEAIVGLYGGDLAAGVYTDEWILARREELRSRYLDLLKRLIRSCLEQHQLERGLKWARQLTAQDPWDEEAVRLQMTLEALTGNRAAAIAAYQRLARDLERELHTQPMPETMALYGDILDNRLPRLAPQRNISPEPHFVGRAHELAQLQALLAALRQGQGRIVFISGEAGVGKTSLLREAFHRFLASSGEDVPRLFWGHCPPPAGDAPPRPYAPWRQVFAAAAPLLVRSAEIPPEWLSRILPLVPDLSLLRPGLLAPVQLDAAELRAALHQGFHFLAFQRPLVLVLEDVHWADIASLELLAGLADICQTLPLLLLVTHRAGDVPVALLDLKRELRRRRCAQEMPLRALSEEESRLLLEKMLGREAVTPALWDEINRYAHGLPLLLHEAAESLRQVQRASRQPLSTLRAAIRMRLAQLDSQARQMLEAAAVLGFSFSHRELEAMLGWPSTAYAAVLDGLQAQRLVLDATSPGLDDYTFSHQLIHQIILDDIPPDRAVLLHERAARALETVHAGRAGFAAEIAAHYEAAQRPVEAARCWMVHAQELTDLAAFAQAEAAIERAIAFIEKDDSRASRELRAQATLQRGVIAHHRGQAAEALLLLESALVACREFPSLYADALIHQASALYTCDRYPEAYQAASQSLEMARTLGEKPAITRGLNIRGMVALMMGRPHEAVQDLQEALALEEVAGPSTEMVQGLNYLGTALVFVQEYARAQEMLTKAVELSRRGGLRRIESAALTMLGQIALNQGRYGEAVGLYSQAIEVAGVSYLPGLWGKFAGRGAALLRTGSLEEARRDFERGFEVARQVESKYGQLLLRAYLALTNLAQGRTPADSLARLEAEAAAFDLHAVVFLTGLARAGLWRLLGRWESALAACQRALQAAQASGVPQFVQQAQLEELTAHALGGTPDLAVLEWLSRVAHAAGEVPQQARASLVLAAYLERQGSPAEALNAAQRGLALARACPDQPLIGEGLLVLLRLHEALGQAEVAQACRAELRAIAATAYAPLHLALQADSPLRPILLASL
jgi:DNA-binding SARP family transcriptional activator